MVFTKIMNAVVAVSSDYYTKQQVSVRNTGYLDQK